MVRNVTILLSSMQCVEGFLCGTLYHDTFVFYAMCRGLSNAITEFQLLVFGSV